jgi:cytochrome c peroxidase
VLVIVGCTSAPEAPDLGPVPTQAPAPPVATKTEDVNPRLLRRFRPLRPAETPDATEQARIDLGKILFFDKRLSTNGDTSCNSCHALDAAGSDGKATSTGTLGKPGTRNAPTVYNSAWHVAMFWDGRAATLEEQAGGPLLNPNEMGMLKPAAVATVLRSIPGYVTAFAKAYPEDAQPVDFTHATRAIASFERQLVTPARWDAFLRGDKAAITSEEIEGLKVFADVGCVQCHTGELLGGSMFQKVGLVEPWPNQADPGRFQVTHLETDRMVFKVPSLRNVVNTGPYFHDGSVTDLRRAVRAMGTHQIGTTLTDGEVDAIVAWLGCLSGEPPASVVSAPILP